MKNELADFIRSKISDVEKAIQAREQMKSTFRSGTDESWAASAELHPSTSGKPFTKEERIAAADTQSRILIKLHQEQEMFRKVLLELLRPQPSKQK